jgi:hypothetical protein
MDEREMVMEPLKGLFSRTRLMEKGSGKLKGTIFKVIKE